MTITLLLIVFFMIEGISKVVFALTIRPFPNWGWVLASGLVGILLALILWASLPVTAVWLIGVLLGINLISVGAAIAYLAWQVGSELGRGGEKKSKSLAASSSCPTGLKGGFGKTKGKRCGEVEVGGVSWGVLVDYDAVSNRHARRPVPRPRRPGPVLRSGAGG